MNPKTTSRLLLLAAALALAACGNKGALVLPDKAASPASDAKPDSPASPPSDASPAAPDAPASPASSAG